MAKSKFEQAKEITDATRKAVYERQKGLSITGMWCGNGADFHHCRFRSDSGVGYEWNIVMLTPQEHRDYHDGKPIKVGACERYTNQEFTSLMKNYLQLHYKRWSWDKTKYHKGWEEEDYEISRNDKE